MGFYEEAFNLEEPKEKSKGINSKKKGDRNENNLIKTFLTPWTGEKFVRTPMSGGFSQKHRSSMFSGDVVNLDRNEGFEFCVETKHYKELKLTSRLLKNNSIIYKFWNQSLGDAVAINKYAMLAVKENNMAKSEYIVFFDEYCSSILIKDFNLLPKYLGKDSNIFGFTSTIIVKNVNYKKFVKQLKDGNPTK